MVATPDRSRFWQAQTPQAFPLGVIMDAYRRAFTEDFPATDDSALVERVGGRVCDGGVVRGELKDHPARGS